MNQQLRVHMPARSLSASQTPHSLFEQEEAVPSSGVTGTGTRASFQAVWVEPRTQVSEHEMLQSRPTSSLPSTQATAGARDSSSPRDTSPTGRGQSPGGACGLGCSWPEASRRLAPALHSSARLPFLWSRVRHCVCHPAPSGLCWPTRLAAVSRPSCGCEVTHGTSTGRPCLPRAAKELLTAALFPCAFPVPTALTSNLPRAPRLLWVSPAHCVWLITGRRLV